jgi:DNA-binding NtrC family response regulator
MSETTMPGEGNRPGTALVLAVSRESAVLGPLLAMGERNRWQVETNGSEWAAMEMVQSGAMPDVIVLDLPHADNDALQFLRWLRRVRPELPIVALCDQADPATQQEAVRLGVSNHVVRVGEEQLLQDAIRKQLAKGVNDVAAQISSDDVQEIGDDCLFVSGSSTMRQLRAQAARLAETDAPVLILGESGSGKQTTARLIHHLSVRSGFPFAGINCAALPSDLLEAELFGDGRSAGALLGPKAGKLELCENGTVLVHEFAEMPLLLQAKLLQVLQTHNFVRPASGETVAVDVRIMAASTTSLEAAVADNKLREDLYYRLSTYTVRVPPLRERREEIPLLLHYFMRNIAKQYGLPARSFSPAVFDACQAHFWPGNLRELGNFVKRLLQAGRKEPPLGGTIEPAVSDPGPSALLARFAPARPECYPVPLSAGSLKSLAATAKLQAEKNAITAVLEKTGWNRKAAAELLHVSYRTLLYKIEQYQIKPGRS